MPTATLQRNGSITLPKALREAQGWESGAVLELKLTSAGLFVQAKEADTKPKPNITLDELHTIVNYTGPYIPESEWKIAIDEMFVREWK